MPLRDAYTPLSAIALIDYALAAFQPISSLRAFFFAASALRQTYCLIRYFILPAAAATLL